MMLLSVKGEHGPLILNDCLQMDRSSPEFIDIGECTLHIFQIELHAFILMLQHQFSSTQIIRIMDDQIRRPPFKRAYTS